MQRSEQINELATALAKAQGMMTSAEKDGKGNYGKYASLAAIWDAIRAPLSTNGLSVTQTMSMDDGRPILETTLMHASGQWETSCVPILAKDGSPQQFGSGLTYARRYGLAPIVGIAADDDDDGEAAQRGYQQAQRPTQVQRPQPAPQQPAPAAPKPTNGNGHAPEPSADQLFEDMTSASQERAEAEPMITPAQIQDLGKLVKQVYGPKESDLESFRKWLKDKYGVESRKELTGRQAAKLTAELETALSKLGH